MSAHQSSSISSLPIDPGIHSTSTNNHHHPNLSLNSFLPSSSSSSISSPTLLQPPHSALIPLSTSTPGSRAFPHKHDAQIIQILATIPNTPPHPSQSHPSLDHPKSSSLKDDLFHPVLRSKPSPLFTPSSSLSSPSPHFDPQLLHRRPPRPPAHDHHVIPTGYGSPSAAPSTSASTLACQLRHSSRPRSTSPARVDADPSVQEGLPNGAPPQTAIPAATWLDSSAEGGPERNSDEWKQHRKNNHKEVERRRRETINEGITELKKIVPGTEKNKGEILKQAVRYISQLKAAEARNSEQWALEKALLEQAVGAQGERIGSLARECSRLEVENESLRRWIVEIGERMPGCGQPQGLGFKNDSATDRPAARSDSMPQDRLGSVLKRTTSTTSEPVETGDQDSDENGDRVSKSSEEDGGSDRGRVDDEDGEDRRGMVTKKTRLR